MNAEEWEKIILAKPQHTWTDEEFSHMVQLQRKRDDVSLSGSGAEK